MAFGFGAGAVGSVGSGLRVGRVCVAGQARGAVARSRVAVRAQYTPYTPPGGEVKKEEPVVQDKDEKEFETPSMPEFNLDTEDLKEKAGAVVDDVKSRPGFYLQIAAVAGVSVVTYTVLSAVVSAVDDLPLLPGVFQLIGLAYTVWFAWRYLLYNDTRRELFDQVRDFLGKASVSSDSD